MGEQNFRIKNIGVANLENINKNLKSKELSISCIRFKLWDCSCHISSCNIKWKIKISINLLIALKLLKCQVIFTFPNNDFGFSQIISYITKFANKNKKI